MNLARVRWSNGIKDVAGFGVFSLANVDKFMCAYRIEFASISFGQAKVDHYRGFIMVTERAYTKAAKVAGRTRLLYDIR